MKNQNKIISQEAHYTIKIYFGYNEKECFEKWPGRRIDSKCLHKDSLKYKLKYER